MPPYFVSPIDTSKAAEKFHIPGNFFGPAPVTPMTLGLGLKMNNKKIAVIGSGISGLSAAWLLSKRHDVTLYEPGQHIGGHANTVDVDTPDGRIPVDTGFIVFNTNNYPNLTALYEHLGVATHQTAMSFAFSLKQGAYEYSGTGANGFFGQRRNVFNLDHWRLLKDIKTFFETAGDRAESYSQGTSLGAFLKKERYSRPFIEDHILPMGAAIWSSSTEKMLSFPARAYLDFYANHGLLQFVGRPMWRSVIGGSRAYVEKLIADAGDRLEVQTGNGAARISRHADHVTVTDQRGALRPFDDVVFATHADVTLKLLEDPSEEECNLLGAFGYQKNRAVLHRDTKLMPRRRRLWSSWNYIKPARGPDSEPCVTYWMNKLQKLPTSTDLFVTLNPSTDIDPDLIEGEFDYDHPVFSTDAMQAQSGLWSLQGQRRSWFCGAYFGYGFHEDGIQSGLAVAEALGGMRRPWLVENESGRIHLPDTDIQQAAE